jgi:DNA-binding transcriptional ArsR family regulator
MEREFKGVWIPKEVWLNKELSLTEKALLAEIDSFTGEGKAFYKSNETIQEEYKVSRPTISKALKKLEGMGFIKVEFDGRRRKVTYQADRKIFTGRRKEFYGQTVNNLPADRKNSTSINTVKEQVKEQSKKSRGFTPPNLEECMSNFQGAGSTSDEGEKFFNFYTSKGWMVGRSKMKDWKAAARNWIKRNNDEQRNKTTAKTSPSRDEFDNYIRHGII